MAATLSSFQVFQDQVHTARTEVEKQVSEAFNQASNGAIVLRPEPKMGDFYDEGYYGKIANLVGVRDVYTDTAVTSVDLAQKLDRSVKFGMSTKPVKIDPSAMSWIQRSPAEAAAVYGQQTAVGSMKQKLNVAISSLTAAISGQSALLEDQGGTAADNGKRISIPHLLKTASRLGDRYNDIALWVMRSESYFKLLDLSINNAAISTLFNYENFMITEFMGRRILVTDDPSLTFTDTISNYYALGLVRDACTIRDQNDFLTNIETSNGKVNIERTYQSEWSSMIGLKGFTWAAAGGKSPTATELGTAANWTKSATDKQDLAGVCLEHLIADA